MMTIDDAIKKNYDLANKLIFDEKTKEEGQYHLQIVQWLKELKKFKNNQKKSCLIVTDYDEKDTI